MTPASNKNQESGYSTNMYIAKQWWENFICKYSTGDSATFDICNNSELETVSHA